MRPIKFSTTVGPMLKLFFYTKLVTWPRKFNCKKWGSLTLWNLTTILCCASITPDTSHSGGLLSIDSSTKGLFVMVKVFTMIVAIFLLNWSIWSRSKNIIWPKKLYSRSKVGVKIIFSSLYSICIGLYLHKSIQAEGIL